MGFQEPILFTEESECKMNTIAHRRQYPRYATVFSTKYTVKEGTFRDLIRDIGAGGLFINTRRKIALGRKINIQIPVFAFGKRLSVMGTVVRCETDGFAVKFREAIALGVFQEGRFPGSVDPVNRSALKIDKSVLF